MARLTLRIGDRRKRIARFGSFVSTGPFNTVPPAITGTPLIPQTLTVSNGTWTGTGSISYARQWLRNGANILGATGSTYTLSAADDLAIISCRITATDDTGSTPALATGVLVTYPAPVNTAPPVIAWVSGTEIGDTMQVTSNGTWTGGGLSYEYQWQRDGADILGATASTYTTVMDDDETTITCLVTASNSGGEATEASNGITVNDAVAPAIAAAPTITGTPALGETLTANPGAVTGTPTPSRDWQWFRNGVAISGATGPTYVVQAADQGRSITVRQRETNTAGVAEETSDAVLIPAFDPATLSPTAWFRPNQTSGNITETTNPSAVASVGGTVGVLLDGSQAYALGSERVTNGDFSSGATGWTVNGTTVTANTGAMVITAATNTTISTNAATTYTNGRLYRIRATISGYSAGAVAFQLSNGGSGPAVGASNINANGTYTFYIVSNGNTTLRVITSGASTTLTLDDISVQEVLGNPVVQATSTARGTLRQEAGPGAYYIEDDGGDTMPWTAPAGTYTVAYVIPDGTVTILTSQSLSGATDMLLASQVVEYIAIIGSLTSDETDGLTAYLEDTANPT